MIYFWTRFLPGYPKTIIYMLQSSEYKINDYLNWLHRSSDFRNIIKRRKLDYTNKASLLLATLWALLFIIYFVVIILIMASTLLSTILAVILFLLSPIIISYLIIVPLFLGNLLIQDPKKRRMVESAKSILADHKALKIAIAGSYGKTTAKEILRTVIGESKNVVFTPGNMNTPIGISRFVQKLSGDEEVIVFELGEEKVGDVLELCELVQPDIGIITGINEAHLSTFGTIENTISTIFELKDYLGDKTLYKNQESPLVLSKIKQNDKLAFSRKGVNGWRVSNIEIDIHGMTFNAKKGDKNISAYTGLIGEYNIGIIMVAVDIADMLGLSTDQIVSGIEKTKPFEHRMQPKLIHGAWVIDDTYNGNSEGVRAGLILLDRLDAKRKVYITPGLVGQGNKTQEVHEKIGRQIAEVADVVVLMQNSVTDYILKGLRDSKFSGKLVIIDDPLEFYTNLDQFIANGDLVLMQNDWTDNYF